MYDPDSIALPVSSHSDTPFNPLSTGFNSSAPGEYRSSSLAQSNDVYLRYPYHAPSFFPQNPHYLGMHHNPSAPILPSPPSTFSSDPPSSDVSSVPYNTSAMLPSGVEVPSFNVRSSQHRGAGAVVTKARRSRKLPPNHRQRLNIVGSSTLGDGIDNSDYRDDDKNILPIVQGQSRPVPPVLPYGFSGISGFSQPMSISACQPVLLKLLKPIQTDEELSQDRRIVPTAVHLYRGLLATSSEMFLVNTTRDWQTLNKERATVAIQNTFLRYNLPREHAHGETSRMCALTTFFFDRIKQYSQGTHRTSKSTFHHFKVSNRLSS